MKLPLKPTFLTDLDLRNIDGATMRLISPLRFRSSIANGVITVPTGFVTDFSSIPRFFHRVIPKNGLHDFGAVVHDWLYKNNGTICIDTKSGRMPVSLSRKLCDNIFLEGMKAKGVPAWRRVIMHRAVLYFGFTAWNSHTRTNRGVVADPCGCAGNIRFQ